MADYDLTRNEAKLVFEVVKDHTAALKNWIATSVESGNIDKAQELVKELRQYQMIYSKVNVEAHDIIEKAKVK